MTGTSALLMGSRFSARPRPLPAVEVAAAVRRHFELEGRWTPLGAERDQNFRLDAGGEAFVVKLAHPAERAAVIDLQVNALVHLAIAEPDLPLPRIVPASNGAATVTLEDKGGEPRILRIVSFLEGDLLHRAKPSRRLLRELGEAAAILARGLAGFDHPERQSDLLWNLLRFPSLRPLLAGHRGDPDEGALIEALEAFEAEVLPRLPDLSCGFVHNDLNPHNVLVAGERITGLLDFGDMAHAPRIVELAVAAAYHLDRDADGLGGAAELVAGYDAIVPLSAIERALLPLLVAARLAMTILITEHRAVEDPGNRDYILRNNPAARRGLRVLTGLGRPAVAERLASCLGKAPAR